MVFVGILHAQEKDFKTAYSYFYESFEVMPHCHHTSIAYRSIQGYDSIDMPVASSGLKYMLLCKILLNEYDPIYMHSDHDLIAV